MAYVTIEDMQKYVKQQLDIELQARVETLESLSAKGTAFVNELKTTQEKIIAEIGIQETRGAGLITQANKITAYLQMFAQQTIAKIKELQTAVDSKLSDHAR